MRSTGRCDGVLLLCILLLCLGGLVMVYSSSAILAQAEGHPETTYLRSQMVKLALGLCLLAVFARMPARLLYGRNAWWILGGAAFLLLLLLLPVGLAATVRGTRRYLNFRVLQMQPAEFARVALVPFLAYYGCAKEEWIGLSWRSLIVPLSVIGGLAGLIVLQPNLSSAALLAVLGFALLYLGGQPLRRLVLVVAPLVLVAAVTLKRYQLERVLGFWKSLAGGESSLPYQVKQSLIALGSGGLHGTGIGQGLQKYHYLPFPHTDFILGIVGEETGLLGVLALFTLYGVILVRGFRIARLASDRFSQMLAAGLTLSIALNFVLHSVVVLGLGPVTGVPLPFFSYGGSSLLVNLIAVGILLSVSREARVEVELSRSAWMIRGGPLRAK
jgi:cell division protein FtsW